MTATTTTAPVGGARRPLAATTGLLALLALLLTGCGAGDDSSANSASAPVGDAGSAASDGSGAAEEQAPGRGEGSSELSTADADRTSARVLPGDRDIVYRGRITVRVRDVARAASRAEDLALQADGVVFSQETSLDPGRGAVGEAQLTLRVPPVEFKPTLDALGGLGRELGRSRSAQDVTTELADTGSRVRSQQRSVDRVRALLDEADTIGEVVQVEAELSRREADLESLQAQLARLKDVTDLATIEVSLVARGQAVEPQDEEDLGFLAGLRRGWDAFVGIGLVGLTGLGAMLPFVAVVAVVGLPAYVLLRGRRRAAAPPATATEA